jgi:hypothetical protein
VAYGGFDKRAFAAEVKRKVQKQIREAQLKVVRAQREQAIQQLKARKELAAPRPEK